VTYIVAGIPADAVQVQTIDEALREAHYELGACEATMICCVMCMTQESTCRPIHYGTLDSLGPYQQRDGWGPASVREDPAGSTRLFLTGGAGGEPGFDHYYSIKDGPDVGYDVAVQTVQVSADPLAYGKWQEEATATVQAWLAAQPNMHYERYNEGGERIAAERYDYWRDRQTATDHPHRAWMLMRKAQCKLYARRIQLAAAYYRSRGDKDPMAAKFRTYRLKWLTVRAEGKKAEPTT
jgi:hypothetical protein